MTNSVLGRENYAFGPCNVYWDTATGGENLFLGNTDQATVTIETTKIELRDSQSGDRPADKAISSQTATVTMGLAKATLERWAKVVQGITLEENTAGEVTKFHLSDKISERDSAVAKTLRLVEIIAGEESTNALDAINFWRAAPSSESIELIFNATDQRYVQIVFMCYKDDTHTDEAGNSVYFSSDEVV